MGYSTRYKLNSLISHWPSGTVAVSSWLKKQGYSNPLLSRYKKSKWISSIGRDANVRPNEKVSWAGGLYAIQEQLQLPVHAGGKTALQLLGYSHFLAPFTGPNDDEVSHGSVSGNRSSINLFGPLGVKLPFWYSHHDWKVNVNYAMTKIFPLREDLELTRKNFGAYSIKISAPERAILEVLYFVPHKETYEEAMLLMEGLSTLRPGLVQQLLKNCNSVKVKRLFMHMAETCNHPWVRQLDPRKINFGKGKRMVVRGGHFDPKYKISVPGRRMSAADKMDEQ